MFHFVFEIHIHRYGLSESIPHGSRYGFRFATRTYHKPRSSVPSLTVTAQSAESQTGTGRGRRPKNALMLSITAVLLADRLSLSGHFSHLMVMVLLKLCSLSLFWHCHLPLWQPAAAHSKCTDAEWPQSRKKILEFSSLFQSHKLTVSIGYRNKKELMWNYPWWRSLLGVMIFIKGNSTSTPAILIYWAGSLLPDLKDPVYPVNRKYLNDDRNCLLQFFPEVAQNSLRIP